MLAALSSTTLSLGSIGQEVKYLQLLLNSFYGPIVPVDGVFSEQTEVLVECFQAACQLLADGRVESKTWHYLEKMSACATAGHTILYRGSTGDEVQYLQVRLNSHFGPRLAIDGIFELRTDLLVRRFQADHQLPPDGLVGWRAWRLLEQIEVDI